MFDHNLVRLKVVDYI